MPARTNRCVLILGMHRSGTSALAGTLREAGLHLGRVQDTGFALNPKGLQEANALIFMHEHLLEVNGGAWHEPPRSIVWGRLHKAVRDLFIESRSEQPLWGFKEPRTLLLLGGWLEALPDWTAVGIFRHPAPVMRSLMERNGFTAEKALSVWMAYNRRLLDLRDRHDFPVIEFTPDAAAMQDGFARALAHLGLPQQRLGFYDSAIPRFTPAEPADVPPEALEMLARLRAHAG